MPFDSDTGAAAASEKWKGKDPSTNRTATFLVKVSPDELAAIDAKAANEGVSRNSFVIRAALEYAPKAEE